VHYLCCLVGGIGSLVGAATVLQWQGLVLQTCRLYPNLQNACRQALCFFVVLWFQNRLVAFPVIRVSLTMICFFVVLWFQKCMVAFPVIRVSLTMI
jgi:hypothetical protein